MIKKLLKNVKANFIKNLDKIIAPKYIVFNINSSVSFEINNWGFYKDIYEIVDAILKEYNLTSDAYIRTFQSFEFDPKWLGFGRMKWNLENNKKWTQKYKLEEFSNGNLQFSARKSGVLTGIILKKQLIYPNSFQNYTAKMIIKEFL